MKNKRRIKIFDAVQMVRDIRDAIYRQAINTDFDPKEFEKIKEKWTKLLELQEQSSPQKISLNE